MDLSQATADDVLRYHAGWRAARQGLPFNDGVTDPFWLAGWADETRAAIQFDTHFDRTRAANDR